MSIELSNYIKSLPKEYDENYSLIINSDNVIVAVILKKLINDNVIRNLYKKRYVYIWYIRYGKFRHDKIYE